MAQGLSGSAATAWELFDARQRELSALGGAMGLLGWDEQVMMPRKGAQARADQRAALASVLHERLIDERFGDAVAELAALNGALDDGAAASVRWARWERDRAVRVPLDLVQALSRTASEGFQTWKAARPAHDFESFRPVLERMVGLKQQEADALGHGGERYDALLDRYEPGMRVAQLEPLLGGLRDDLLPFAHEIFGKPRPDCSFLERTFPEQAQWDFSMRVLADLGFDLEAGRQDLSPHPFTGGTSPRDVRVTTRYVPGDPRGSLMATIHEAGHGLYEQGLDVRELEGTFAGEAASLGLHESQSRFWENQVGRSRAFWGRYAPVMRSFYPGLLDDVDDDRLYRSFNNVEPSLIRVEADEVTYNLHILLRFELELALLRGELAVADLPAAWDDAMERYLGIRPPHVGDGVMQDIHWSSGSIGYFPTYTLGNLYAAQLVEALERDLGDLSGLVARGAFGDLLAWLREHIHRRGRVATAQEIARDAVGRDLEHQTLMAYLRRKYGELYGV